MSENQNIEFKNGWRDDYLKWISGFANANGGILYIGVDDKGNVVGLKNIKKLMEDLPNKIRDILGIMADVNLLEKEGKKYIEIIVEPYNTPISYRGKFYYRSGSTLQELKGPALEKMFLKKMGKKWDGITAYGFTLADLSEEAFSIFRKRAKRAKRIPIEDIEDSNENLLNLLGMYNQDGLKRAAILSFGKNPEKLVTGAYVKIGFFRTHTELLYQDEIHGSLFEQVEKTMDLLLTKYLKANITYEGLTRSETYDYPEEALREAILNAIIHKDYTSGSPVQISVYENMLWINNSGELPSGWTVETLKVKHRSDPANPDIANVFFRAGYIEIWGRGTINIIEHCKRAGLPEPDFRYNGGLTIVFKKEDKPFEELSKNIGEAPINVPINVPIKKLSENEKRIILLILEDEKITIKELAKKTGMNERTIKRNIEKLKNKSILKREGSRKSGYWKIIKR